MMLARFLLLLCLAATASVSVAQVHRVVTLGGSVTEIVYALGEGGRVVADDESSLYPDAALRLPRVGYYRSVPLEGVVSMNPDLVLASENAGPPATLQRLSELGIATVVVSDQPSVESLYRRIEQIAGQLGVAHKGQSLTRHIRNEVAAAIAQPSRPQRAIVLVNRTGSFMAAGAGTAADAVLNLAGLDNVLSAQQGYKPVSAEGLVVLAPDLIIVTAASVHASGGLDAFRQRAGIASTPAATHKRIEVMDDLLILGIGPRVAQALQQLKKASQ